MDAEQLLQDVQVWHFYTSGGKNVSRLILIAWLDKDGLIDTQKHTEKYN